MKEGWKEISTIRSTTVHHIDVLRNSIELNPENKIHNYISVSEFIINYLA